MPARGPGVACGWKSPTTSAELQTARSRFTNGYPSVPPCCQPVSISAFLNFWMLIPKSTSNLAVRVCEQRTRIRASHLYAHACCSPACALLSDAHRADRYLFKRSEEATGRGATRGRKASRFPFAESTRGPLTVKFEPRVEPNRRSALRRLIPRYTPKTRNTNYQGSRSRRASPFFLRFLPPEVSVDVVGDVFGAFDFSDSNSFK